MDNRERQLVRRSLLRPATTRKRRAPQRAIAGGSAFSVVFAGCVGTASHSIRSNASDDAPKPLLAATAALGMVRTAHHADHATLGTKARPELVYFEASIRNRTPFIVENIDRLSDLPLDGLMVNIPASWQLMSGDRWTFDDSFTPWIAPLLPIFSDPARGLRSNYLMAFVDRPADFIDDWTTAIANFRDLARLARAGGFVGIAIDNEEYARPLWDWPSSVDRPERGFATYAAAARARGNAIGAAMSTEFPRIRVMTLHGPYVADANVPDTIRRNQSDVGAFELFGPFYSGLLEGLGPDATVIDGGEVYALRTQHEFRDHAIWRRWGPSSNAHDAALLTPHDRSRQRRQGVAAFGVSTGHFPAGFTMSAPTLRTTLENALRKTDGVVWLYAEEGRSAWEPAQMGTPWRVAISDAVAAVREAPRQTRYSIEDLHPVAVEPFDADLNGVVDAQDADAVEREVRSGERKGVLPRRDAHD